MKQCIDCAKNGIGPKPLSEFNKNSRAASGLHPVWRKANPTAARTLDVRKYLRHKYGLSEAQYTQMFVGQGCCCAICRTPLKSQLDTTREFTNRVKISGVAYVDHDHSSGTVRGLLCFSCNIILGKAKDSEKVLLQAARYLRENVTVLIQPTAERKSVSEIAPGNRNRESHVRCGNRREELSPF